MTIIKGLALCSLAGLLALPLACDNEINCVQICQRYQECDTNIDVTECTNLCEDRTDDNDNARVAAERCEDCLDRGSCAETTSCFDPGTDCPVVVVRD